MRWPCEQASRLVRHLASAGASSPPRRRGAGPRTRRGLRARWLRGESQQEAREKLQDSEVQEDEGGRALARMGGMAARLDPDVLLPLEESLAGSLLPPSPRRRGENRFLKKKKKKKNTKQGKKRTCFVKEKDSSQRQFKSKRVLVALVLLFSPFTIAPSCLL